MNVKRKKALVILLVSLMLLFTVISSSGTVMTSVSQKPGAAWGAFSIETGGGWTAMVSGVAGSTAVGAYYGSCFGPCVGTIAGAIVGL
ncbi:MAG: hypothetical protein J7L86_04525 [Candidatus Marinimicrobia bacterium]|nr:hypothetical protein [Candidatus Neomarinimicrobiota bacterium]